VWLALVRRSLAERRELRRLRRIPRSALATVVEGSEVRVVGLARPLGPALEAPLSGRICVCHAVVIYEWRADGSVRIAYTDQARVPFMLAEDDDRAVVEPGHAALSAGFDHERRMIPADAHAILASLGVHDRDWSAATALELAEAIIELDERIAVIGTAIREPDLDASPLGYRDGDRPVRLRLIPTTISDDPRLCR
jgi:hypothetical protein